MAYLCLANVLAASDGHNIPSWQADKLQTKACILHVCQPGHVGFGGIYGIDLFQIPIATAIGACNNSRQSL